MGLVEWKKPHPSSKVIRKVMKDTFALRRIVAVVVRGG